MRVMRGIHAVGTDSRSPFVPHMAARGVGGIVEQSSPLWAAWTRALLPTGHPVTAPTTHVARAFYYYEIQIRTRALSLAASLVRPLTAGRDVGGVDACQGDSGGPLLLPKGTPSSVFTAAASSSSSTSSSSASAASAPGLTEDVLLGVVSWGRGCGEPGNWGVYTYLPQYRDWVNQKLAVGGVCTCTCVSEQVWKSNLDMVCCPGATRQGMEWWNNCTAHNRAEGGRGVSKKGYGVRQTRRPTRTPSAHVPSLRRRGRPVQLLHGCWSAHTHRLHLSRPAFG